MLTVLLLRWTTCVPQIWFEDVVGLKQSHAQVLHSILVPLDPIMFWGLWLLLLSLCILEPLLTKMCGVYKWPQF